MKIQFYEDFAGNFKKGQVVEAEDKGNGQILVDKVALIEKETLMTVACFVEDLEETEGEDSEEAKLNNEQTKAFKMITENTDSNYCILGDAGTGKTFLISKLIEEWRKKKKKVMVLASTGTAAMNINGVTAHSALKLPIEVMMNNPKLIVPEVVNADIIIIDEVGFLRFDIFEVVWSRINYANKQREKFGVKPIQIVVSGDFFQLAPVITDEDRKALIHKYGDNIGRGFAFQSYAWGEFKFKYIYLTEQMRNKDDLFVNYLNKLKVGDLSVINNINYYCRDNEVGKDAVYVCGTNKEVNEINRQRLEEVDGKAYNFLEESSGEFKDSDRFAPASLDIKIGCRVMCTVNNRDYGFINGSVGTVVAVSEIQGLEGYEEAIRVKLDNGRIVNVPRYTNEIKKYKVNSKGNLDDKLTTEVVGWIRQFPLILAYAITIHKCQGKTIDKVRVNPYCWEHGQLYVALSRVRRFEDLHLERPIYGKYLVCDKYVQVFYNAVRNMNQLDKM